MLENIINIGRFIEKTENSKTITDLWIKDNKPMDLVLTINISNEFKILSYTTKEFTKDIYKRSLFYQQGNDLKKGSGISIHKAKALIDENNKEHKDTFNKVQKKLKYSLEFMEIPTTISDEIMNIILKEIPQNSDKTYFVEIKKDGNDACSLFREKFELEIKKQWKTDDKLSKKVKNTTCHSCGYIGKNYDTAIYNCYNNDKETYSNIYSDIGKDVFGYSLCEKCILSLLNGRYYVNEYMTTNWLGSKVMFLPHKFNSEIQKIYEHTISKSSNDSDCKDNTLLKNIHKSESEVFRHLSESDTLTDIIFFKSENSYWGITYSIQGVLPSNFGKLEYTLSQYEKVTNSFEKLETLSLKDILDFLCLTNSQKERMKMLDILLSGRKINRNTFFSTSLKKYKDIYIKSSKEDKYFTKIKQLSKIKKIYNILVDMGCLENGLCILCKEGDNFKTKQYKNQEEFFELNKDFFDNSYKKAWFILGHLYNKTIYESKRYHNKSKDEKLNMENNSLILQAFNKDTFIKISNICKEQLSRYGRPKAYTYLFRQIKELLLSTPIKNKSLSRDEAKFIFLWGIEIFFTDNLTKSNNKSNKETNS